MGRNGFDEARVVVSDGTFPSTFCHRRAMPDVETQPSLPAPRARQSPTAELRTFHDRAARVPPASRAPVRRRRALSGGPLPVYLVGHPDGVRHVLQDNARNYSKDTFQYNLLSTITGNGLLTSDGDFWLQAAAAGPAGLPSPAHRRLRPADDRRRRGDAGGLAGLRGAAASRSTWRPR